MTFKQKVTVRYLRSGTVHITVRSPYYEKPRQSWGVNFKEAVSNLPVW